MESGVEDIMQDKMEDIMEDISQSAFAFDFPPNA
jgi:hypothetical protein